MAHKAEGQRRPWRAAKTERFEEREEKREEPVSEKSIVELPPGTLSSSIVPLAYEEDLGSFPSPIRKSYELPRSFGLNNATQRSHASV